MVKLKDIFNLFYPDICISCSKSLLKNEKILCAFCCHDLPLININNCYENRVETTFFGRLPIKKTISFLEYKKESIAQKLIHELKYKGNEEVGVFLGNWFGNQLQETKIFNDVDYIIPVPLHKKKEKTRGYNQLTKFGKCLSEKLNISYNDDTLFRISSTKTQTLKQRFERFTNTNTTFSLIDRSIFENKHVLLIDDVITTGATLEACCNELLKTKNITISIATMAYTERY